jgi:hypothetical protein
MAVGDLVDGPAIASPVTFATEQPAMGRSQPTPVRSARLLQAQIDGRSGLLLRGVEDADGESGDSGSVVRRRRLRRQSVLIEGGEVPYTAKPDDGGGDDACQRAGRSGEWRLRIGRRGTRFSSRA